ncbi:MAG: SLC13 family permease [Phycisphaerales bacterium]
MGDGSPQVANDSEASVSARIAWLGRVGAPLLAVLVYALASLDDGMSPAARATAAIGVLMAILWMTEAMPLPATALLPIVLFPASGVLAVRDATAPYADPVIFLFMGGFILALAMERWGLHKRIALVTVLLVGTRPRALIAGFMLATGVLSMWISNTATAVMMLPIATSIIALASERFEASGEVDPAASARFAVCLLLGIAYSASIGGVGTPIGTPPNAVLIGFVQQEFDITIGFGEWMAVGAPFSAVFGVITWAMLVYVLYPVRIRELPGGRALIRTELQRLGPMSRAEWMVFVVFLTTATLWIFRQRLAGWDWLAGAAPVVTRIDDTVIAIAAAALLFALPVEPRRGVFVMNWTFAKRLPWGVLLLFGGGLSLARAVGASGLDEWLGAQVGALGWLPTLALVIVITTVVVFLTEVTSNTATATTFLPILAGVGVGLGVNLPTLLVPAAIAASCAFMMPVATPPNAIVFGSGRVTIGQMVKVGIWLNLIGIVLITVLTYTLVQWTFVATYSGGQP